MARSEEDTEIVEELETDLQNLKNETDGYLLNLSM